MGGLIKVSIISSVFIISSYYYVDKLLGHFNLNSSEFYTLNDYTVASLDYSVSPLIWSCILIITTLLGAYHKIGERIWHEQLKQQESEKTFRNDPLGLSVFLMILMNTIIIIVCAYIGKNVPVQLIMINIMVVLFYILERLPYNLFANPIAAYISAIAIMIFSFHIVSNVSTDIEKLELGTYKPKYSVEFIEPKLKKNNLDFLITNSTYIFMINKDDNKLKIIPRNQVKELIPRTEEKDKSLLVGIIDYFAALFKMIVKAFS